MPEKLDVISWNVHFPKFAEDCGYVVDLLSIENPDVICLQEYVDGKDELVRAWLTENDYSFDYLPFGYDEVGRFSQGTMTAIRNKYNPTTNEIRLREDGPRRFRNFHNIRGILSSSVEVEGAKIDILNTHLTLPRPWTVDMRKEEFSELKGFLSLKEGNPTVMVGDFNFLLNDSRKRYLKNTYSYFTGSIFTKTWKWRGLPGPVQANLDAAFWDEKLIAVSGQIMPLQGYDHRPLKLEVCLL